MVPREICLQIIALLRRMFIVFKAGGTMRAGGHLVSRFWLISYPYSNHSGTDHAHHINTCPPRLSDFPPALVLLRLIAACRQRILGGYGHWEENEWRYKDWPPQGRRKGMGRGGSSPLHFRRYLYYLFQSDEWGQIRPIRPSLQSQLLLGTFRLASIVG